MSISFCNNSLLLGINSKGDSKTNAGFIPGRTVG